MQEIWKSIPGYDGYEVSNLGRVRTFYKRVGRSWVIVNSPQKILSSALRNKSYKVVRPKSNDGQKKIKTIHALVALAFIGPCPEGMEVCHSDGNSFNNSPDNLRYDTRKNNLYDMVINNGGVHPFSKGKPTRKQKVLENKNKKFARNNLIKELRHSGLQYSQISEQTGLSVSAICRIIKGNRRNK